MSSESNPRQQLKERVAQLTLEQQTALTERLMSEYAVRSPRSDVQLVAYVEARPGEAITESALRDHMKRTVPHWMVPSQFALLQRLPRTVNGKVDRTTLLTQAMPPARALEGDALESPTEVALGSIWAELLGGRSPQRHDDFFEAGGDSILALTCTAKIQKRFGVTLPVSALFERPTIAQLAELLRLPEQALPPTLVAIRDAGSEPPLFCAHCVKGRIHHYFPLAEKLGPSQPVYALQPAIADGSEIIPDRLDVIAQGYIEAIRQVRPHGPYRLCGYSFGGMVAFEIARQLEEDGERVEFVALFDTVLMRAENVSDHFARHREHWESAGMVGRIQFLFNKVWGVSQTLARRLRTAPVKFLIKSRMTVSRWLRRPLPVELHEFFLARPYNHAMSTYRPEPFNGRLILFKTRASEWMESRYPNKGWTGMSESLVVEDMPGDHDNLMKAAQAELLGARLQRHLNESSR